jgi:glycine cleavage system H protein
MKALKLSFSHLLAVTGSVGLAIIAIPIVTVIALLLRAAALFVIPVVVLAAVVLVMASPRFRGWFKRSIDPDERYKGLRLARDVAVDPGHAWVKPTGAKVTIGADDLLTAVIGPLEGVDLPMLGQEFQRGDVLFRLKRANRHLEIRAPISGTVVARNPAVWREPTLVNEDPFHRGWLLKIREAPDVPDDQRPLRRGRDLTTWFRNEVDRLQNAVMGDALPVLADGGPVELDLYRRIDDPAWQRVKDLLKGTQS